MVRAGELVVVADPIGTWIVCCGHVLASVRIPSERSSIGGAANLVGTGKSQDSIRTSFVETRASFPYVRCRQWNDTRIHRSSLCCSHPSRGGLQRHASKARGGFTLGRRNRARGSRWALDPGAPFIPCAARSGTEESHDRGPVTDGAGPEATNESPRMIGRIMSDSGQLLEPRTYLKRRASAVLRVHHVRCSGSRWTLARFLWGALLSVDQVLAVLTCKVGLNAVARYDGGGRY
ncbi:MAG: hypothetical protein RL701_1721 [Pseudomonadota bacterium]